jgi:hypothetical protein
MDGSNSFSVGYNEGGDNTSNNGSEDEHKNYN